MDTRLDFINKFYSSDDFYSQSDDKTKINEIHYPKFCKKNRSINQIMVPWTKQAGNQNRTQFPHRCP